MTKVGRIFEEEKLAAIKKVEQEKEEEKAQALREKEKEKVRALREKEKEKARALRKQEQEKEKEKARALQKQEREKEKEKAMMSKTIVMNLMRVMKMSDEDILKTVDIYTPAEIRSIREELDAAACG